MNYLSLPSFGIKKDQRDKSVIMLKSIYITSSVKVLKLPEHNMMFVDQKPTYILQGVVGVFLVKDRRPRGTTLPTFDDIFDVNDNYKADALLKSSLRSRYSILRKKKVIVNEPGTTYIEDLRLYIKMPLRYPVWSMF